MGNYAGYLMFTEKGYEKFLDMESTNAWSKINDSDIKTVQFDSYTQAKEEIEILLKEKTIRQFALVDTDLKRLCFRANSRQTFNYIIDENQDNQIKDWLRKGTETDFFYIYDDNGGLLAEGAKGKKLNLDVAYINKVIQYFESKGKPIEKILVKNFDSPIEWHNSRNEEGSIVVTCGIH